MSARFYFVVSGAVFASIAIVHCIRLVEGWVVRVGPWVAPMWVSWLGVLVTLALAAWAFTLAGRSGG